MRKCSAVTIKVVTCCRLMESDMHERKVSFVLLVFKHYDHEITSDYLISSKRVKGKRHNYTFKCGSRVAGRKHALCESSSFKRPSILVISLNRKRRTAGACLHANNSYLGCQPHLTKDLPRVSRRERLQRVTLPTTIPDNLD